MDLHEGNSEVQAKVATNAALQIHQCELHKFLDAEKLVRQINVKPAVENNILSFEGYLVVF